MENLPWKVNESVRYSDPGLQLKIIKICMIYIFLGETHHLHYYKGRARSSTCFLESGGTNIFRNFQGGLTFFLNSVVVIDKLRLIQ